MALDRRRDGARQAPPAGEDAADEGVVDTEVAALAVHALLRGLGIAVDLGRVAGVGVHEHELADVVQQRGDHEAVAVLVAGLAGEAVGGALRGDAVQAEALGRGVPDGRALEEVKGAGAAGERLHGFRREQLDGLDDGLDAAAAALVELVGHPQDGDDEGDVGLDGGDDVGRRDAVGADETQQAVARLGQGGECLERLERSGQAAAVAFIVMALDGRAARLGCGACGRRDHGGRSLLSGRDRRGTPGIGSYRRMV
jgi:hypothetical protein